MHSAVVVLVRFRYELRYIGWSHVDARHGTIFEQPNAMSRYRCDVTEGSYIQSAEDFAVNCGQCVIILKVQHFLNVCF